MMLAAFADNSYSQLIGWTATMAVVNRAAAFQLEVRGTVEALTPPRHSREGWTVTVNNKRYWFNPLDVEDASVTLDRRNGQPVAPYTVPRLRFTRVLSYEPMPCDMVCTMAQAEQAVEWVHSFAGGRTRPRVAIRLARTYLTIKFRHLWRGRHPDRIERLLEQFKGANIGSGLSGQETFHYPYHESLSLYLPLDYHYHWEKPDAPARPNHHGLEQQ